MSLDTPSRPGRVKPTELLKGIRAARRHLKAASDAIDRRDSEATYAALERAQHAAYDTRAVLVHGGTFEDKEDGR